MARPVVDFGTGSMAMQNPRLQRTLPLLVGALLVLLIVYRGVSFYLQWRAEPQALTPTPSGASQPAATQPQPETFQGLANLHLFGVPAAAPKAQAKADIPETRAQLKLHGVFVDGEQSGAIIAETDGTQHFVPVHGELAGGIKLKEVHADHVVLERQGQDEALRFPKAPSLMNEPARPAPARAPEPAASGPTPAPANLAGLDAANVQRYLRAFPVQEDGVLVGFRVLPGQERGLYQRLGLRPGDVVTEINGEPMNPQTDADGFLRQLVANAEPNLTVRRGNEVLQLQVSAQ